MEAVEKKKLRHELLRGDFSCQRSTESEPLPLACTPHLHSDLELIYMERGAVLVQVGSRSEILKEGDVFLSFPHQIHAFSDLGKSEAYMRFTVKPEVFPEYTELFRKQVPDSPIIRSVGEIPRVDDLFRMLFDSEQEADVPPVQKVKRRSGYLLALLSELLARMSLHPYAAEDANSLRDIIRYCAEHFAEGISLSSLEEELHLSKYHVSHLFNKELGMGFSEYINLLRVSEACRLLLNSPESVTRIGEAVGFNTLRTFNRAFIRHTGVSPSEYRRAGASAEEADRFTRLSMTARIPERAGRESGTEEI